MIPVFPPYFFPVFLLSLLFLGPSRGLTGEVTLEWEPNPEPDITGYRIYYGRTPGHYPERVDVGLRTRVVLPDLPGGVTWYAVATAVNAAGLESEPSVAAVFHSGPVPQGPAAESRLILAETTALPVGPLPFPDLDAAAGKPGASYLVGGTTGQLVSQFETSDGLQWFPWCRVDGTEPASDPWLISLDGQVPQPVFPAPVRNGSRTVTTGTPPWTRLLSMDGAPLRLPLEPGPHTLVLQFGDSGFPPDRILLNSGPAPVRGEILLAEGDLLTVISPPQPQSVFEGGSAVFGATTAATGPVAWQWFHNGVLLDNAVAATLTVAPVTAADAGEYQVRVTLGEAEVLTPPALLTVAPRPALTVLSGTGPPPPAEHGVELQATGAPLQPRSVEVSENLRDWALLEAFRLDAKGIRTLPDPTKTARGRYYRLRAGE